MRFAAHPRTVLRLQTIDALSEAGIAAASTDALRELVAAGHDEKLVVWLFLKTSCIAEGLPASLGSVVQALHDALAAEQVPDDLLLAIIDVISRTS